jgi:hypothetical protein
MEITSSHYIAFTAFVQLAVALNFGLDIPPQDNLFGPHALVGLQISNRT